MTDQDAKPDFEAALARFLDGESEPDDGELLARQMKESPEMLRMVSGMLAIDDLLRQQAEPRPESFVEAFVERLEAEASAEGFVRRVDAALVERQRAVRSRWRQFFPWLMTIVACVVALVGWWQARPPRLPKIDGAPETAATGPASSSLALMVNEAGARFAAGAGPEAVSFASGRYDLLEGAAHLRFRNGADVVFVAPARFVIDDAAGIRMEEGRLRAFVPQSAHGFTVSAPGVQYRDLGTEFGVTVNKATGQSELHVFDGEVEVLRDGSAKPEATITTGQSVGLVQGKLQTVAAPAKDTYPTVDSISLRRWNVWRERLHRDPNLVLYYPCIPDSKDANVLRDEAEHGAKVQGHIEDARWVAGRWPGKKALQFEDPDDRVSLTIPGEFEQLTLAAWVKVDRLDNPANALLDSVGWLPGGVHWEMSRRAELAASAVYSDPKRAVVRQISRVPLGQWVHVALTADRHTGQLLSYINGQLACIAQFAPDSQLKPGQCHLGYWKPGNKQPQVRDFRGRMDEVIVWRVALSPARIAELAEAGMPVELPESGK